MQGKNSIKSQLIYNWGKKISFPRKKKVELNDETLRDGLQATYVRHPTLLEKIGFLKIIEKLNIESVNIGFPVSGGEQKKDIIALAKYAKRNNFEIELVCGGRVLVPDVESIVEVAQAAGVKLNAGLFIGSSKIRYLVEKWNLREMGKKIKKSISFAVKNGLIVTFVTEDTTRADPKTIYYLYNQALESGATRICICDTVGYANQWSTSTLISFIKSKIIKNNRKIKIEWHGHNDRGLATANSIAAAYAGVDRIYATALGVGERAGNTSMVELLINLQIEGFIKKNLTYLSNYYKHASKILGVAIPPNEPVIGRDVFKTATGVHAAAIKKAIEMKNKYLAGIIYSVIDPTLLKKEPEIFIGPMSGRANVEWVLKKLHVSPRPGLIKILLNKAKSERRILLEQEVIEISQEFHRSTP